MKKMTAWILLLCMLLSCSVAMADSATGWLNQRISTRTGPGTKYTEPGSFLKKGDTVTVHTKAWDSPNRIWWVQVEFSYGGDRYRAYTGAQRMNVDLSDVPEERALQSVRVTSDADAFAGPGWSYVMWNDTVYRGTSATLYEVENGYGHIECWNSRERKTWRVWVPLNCLDCYWDYSSNEDTYPSYGGSSGGYNSGSSYSGGYSSDGSNWPVGEICYITVDSGNARAGAGVEYREVNDVCYGEGYTIYDAALASNDVIWFKIYKDGMYCWISSGLTGFGKLTSSDGGNPSCYEDTGNGGYTGSSSGGWPVGEFCTIVVDSGKARSGAGTEYGKLTEVNYGESYLILGTARASNNVTWFQIMKDGMWCWISSGLTDFGKY